MHVVIGGCGRVGAQLAVELSDGGYGVAIIDKDPRAFRRLGDTYGGKAVQGIVFDRATLEVAGIRKADAYVAVTNGDNSNIVSARTAHEHYGVDRVVARIYDPARAHIYARFGIDTIASAQWTVEAIERLLLPPAEHIAGDLGPGPSQVVLVSLTVPDSVHAVPAVRAERAGEASLAAVTREGHTSVPSPNTLLEAGDQVHLAVRRDALEAVRAHVAALSQGAER